jgi:hypothetical protein
MCVPESEGEEMSIESWRWLTTAALVALPIFGCGGGGGGNSADGGTTGVASIAISASTTAISPGQTATLTAFPTDAQGNVLSSLVLSWQSSNAAVATVADGVVTGIAAGTVNVSASIEGVTSNVVTLSISAASGAPTNTDRPVVTVTDRTTYLDLVASTGSWSNNPTSYSYGWLRNGSAIAGAALPTYSTTQADQGTSVAAVVTAANGVGSSQSTSPAVAVPVPATVPTDPTLGAHALVFHVSRGSVGATLPTPALNTQSGSTMLAFVGKGSVFNLQPPTDNLGNSPYVQLGSIHEYSRWPGEGTAVYAFNSIVGGANHIVRVNDSNTFDEVTFAAVEVRHGGVVQDLQWREVLNSSAQTSASVTTTGPATLVAVWYGDDASSTPSRPVPNNGFTVIEGNGKAVESVQMFVATKNVSAAGTYNVTWNTTPLQGAQLYLVAVQKQP